MRTKIILLSLILLNSFGTFAQNNRSDTSRYNNITLLYLNVDELPYFQSDSFNTALEYIYSNIKLPRQFGSITGTVIVSFVVTKYGKIERIWIERGLHEAFDKEVKRVLLSMPKWRAGKKNNKFVNTLLFLPIDFRLHPLRPVCNGCCTINPGGADVRGCCATKPVNKK